VKPLDDRIYEEHQEYQRGLDLADSSNVTAWVDFFTGQVVAG
jgi:hypothetical protein